MRASAAIFAIACAGVAFACMHAARSQEATSANLPDGFPPLESAPASKPKNKAEPRSQTLATTPNPNVAPGVRQTSAPEELPTIRTMPEKHPKPSPAIEENTNITSARVTKEAPPSQEAALEIAAAKKKAGPKKQPRAAVQIKATAVPEPVPMSLSVAQSMAISAPLPEYTYEAKRRNLAGSGICLVTVDPVTGRVTDARMFQSTGSTMLDKLTIQTFKSWRFKPGTVSQVRVPISYE